MKTVFITLNPILILNQNIDNLYLNKVSAEVNFIVLAKHSREEKVRQPEVSQSQIV